MERSRWHTSDEMVAAVPRLRMPELKQDTRGQPLLEKARGSRTVLLVENVEFAVRMNPDPMYCN